MNPTIKIIAAMTKQRVIGKDNTLPWHLPDDLKNFKNLTQGQTVIMGRKTYESIPERFRPLPNRYNIVLTRSKEIPEVATAPSLKQALVLANQHGKDIYIIGGSSVYQEALPIAHQLILSHVHENHEGDTYFPEISDEWKITNTQPMQGFDLVTYEKWNQSK